MTEAFLTDLLDYVLVLEYPLECQKRVNLRKINHYRPVPGDSVVSQKLFSKREDLILCHSLSNICRDLPGSDY